jgi:(E)-4-hydroxy-3-methyl-but-2-enyl pyrophosphate reductase
MCNCIDKLHKSGIIHFDIKPENFIISDYIDFIRIIIIDFGNSYFIEDIDKVPEHSILIFSAHGVSAKVEIEAKAFNLRSYDATCPLVTKVHSEVQRHARAGRDIILIGHDGHPEVEGTLGRHHPEDLGSKIYLVQDLQEAHEIEVMQPENLAYVTQTTLSHDDTISIVLTLYERFPHILKPKSDDICYATQNRQDAVKQLALESEFIIVIGSSNSSNSNRLMELAEKWFSSILYTGTSMGEHGSYSPSQNALRLCTHDEGTFFHELAHKADDKNGNLETKDGAIMRHLFL